MVRLNIDGARHSGNYRCDCECGASWHGQGESVTGHSWSPALPIAECMVHLREQHPKAQFDLGFSERFRLWLVSYWDEATMRLAREKRRPSFAAQVRLDV